MNKRLIILGIDGMDPDLVNLFMKDGSLPNIAGLAARGTMSRFPTIVPPQSPSVWTTLSSGVYPERHGVFDFIQRKAGSYLPYLSINSMNQKSGKFENPNRAVPFWRVTSKAGIPTSVYRWPASFPPEEINGEMLSGLGTPDVKGFLGVYTYYTDEDLPVPSDARKNVRRITFSGDKATTVLEGPLAERNKAFEKELIIQKTVDGVSIGIDGNTLRLKADEWSSLLTVSFRKGLLGGLSGVCKFHLMSVNPFRLYATPVQLDPSNPIVPFTHPKGLSSSIAKAIGPFQTLGMPEDTSALNKKHLDMGGFNSLCASIDKEREAMFREALKRFRGGVLAFVFDTSDRLQHIHFRKGGPNTEIRQHYAKMDRLIGEVVKMLSPEDSLIILSDHGITSYDYDFHLNTFLVQKGFMHLTSEPGETNKGELFSLVDWTRTKAYALGFSGIYINMQGREPHGTVARSEKEKVAAELRDALLGFAPAGFRKPVIAVYPTSVKDDPLAPDLIIGMNEGFRVSSNTAIGGVSKDVLTPNNLPWCADHIVDRSLVDGLLITNRRVTKAPLMVDLAPTVTSFFGVSPDPSWEGKTFF
ncbi:MAG: alkaline phosphatase family protein [Thermodesulfovibrionales bacterium]